MSDEPSEATFSLADRSEVQLFQDYVDDYVRARLGGVVRHISLPEAYDALQARDDGGRIFSALVDLFLTFVFLHADQVEIGGTWNSLFSRGKFEGGSVLDHSAKFQGKLHIHRFSTSYVLRYRAFWDKLMGLIVLFGAPQRYDEFLRAKSRKKAFVKIAGDTGVLSAEETEVIVHGLARFDDRFRTPEAHGPGVLRKWTLTMAKLHENPQIELLGYWNFMNSTLMAVMKRIGFGRGIEGA